MTRQRFREVRLCAKMEGSVARRRRRARHAAHRRGAARPRGRRGGAARGRRRRERAEDGRRRRDGADTSPAIRATRPRRCRHHTDRCERQRGPGQNRWRHGAVNAACQNGHTEVVTKLLAANANVNQANNDGATPLYIACQQGHAEIVTQLLAANANVNKATERGATPLSSPAIQGPHRGRHEAARRERQREPGRQRWRHAAVHGMREWPRRGRHDAAAANADVNRPATMAPRRCTSPASRATPRSSRSCSLRTPT